MRRRILLLLVFILNPVFIFASEANLKIPELSGDQRSILLSGLLVCFVGLLFGLYQYYKVKNLKAHQSMLDVAQIIFETCKTYLIQQGKFLGFLFLFIASCIAFYFGYLLHTEIGGVFLILGWTVVGILGS